MNSFVGGDRGAGVLDGAVRADPHEAPLAVRHQHAQQVVGSSQVSWLRLRWRAGVERPGATTCPSSAQDREAPDAPPLRSSTARPGSGGRRARRRRGSSRTCGTTRCPPVPNTPQQRAAREVRRDTRPMTRPCWLTSETFSIGPTRATMPWEVETQTCPPRWTKTVQPPPSGSCSWQVCLPEIAEILVPWATRGIVEVAGRRRPRPRAADPRSPSQPTISWSGETSIPKCSTIRLRHRPGARDALQLRAGLGSGHADRAVTDRGPRGPGETGQLQRRSRPGGGAASCPRRTRARRRRRRGSRGGRRSASPTSGTGRGRRGPRGRVPRGRRGCAVAPRRTTRPGAASRASANAATGHGRDRSDFMVMRPDSERLKVVGPRRGRLAIRSPHRLPAPSFKWVVRRRAAHAAGPGSRRPRQG